MANESSFDVIIIGGSYAGLSAAMSLGRSLRQVLVIDSNNPCNASTPHSHNFITHDGKTPKEISNAAREQVSQYPTVSFYNGTATKGKKIHEGFQIETDSGKIFSAIKLLFATGIKDIMPDIKGFKECWGISVIHCPYCHGYEYRHQKTGIFANGDTAFHYVQLVDNLTKDLTLFTNGKSTLTPEQTLKLAGHQINIVETEIAGIEHDNGIIKNILLKDSSKVELAALYARVAFVQHSDIPFTLGCQLTEQGYIQADAFNKTTVDGIFACGDNVSMMRSVANAVGAGTYTGAIINKEMIEERF